VQRIVRDANRASDVIARIRSFLRRGDLVPTAVDVEQVIGEVLGLVQADSRAQGVVMRHTPVRGIPPVRVDRVQLQQVILNLVVNALEAMTPLADATRTLAIGTHREPQFDLVRVDVCDSGSGIPPGDRDRLFDAFHTTKPEGMGMGLAISRSIIESHGGRLWFTRNDDRGVTFHFTLPVAQQPC
jgi:signal transduction histidine kinase